MAKQAKQPKGVLYPRCMVCGKSYEFNKQKTNCYCSPACKQEAYRQRKGIIPTQATKEQHYRKVIETKRTQEVNIYCAVCNRHIIVDQTRTNTIYCSPACKQSAYRQRTKEKNAVTAKILAMCEFSSWIELPGLIAKLELEFFNRHSFNWTLINSTVRINGSEAYLDDKYGQVLAYFQNKDRAKQWLAFYVVNGRANYAMLRQR